MQKYFGSFYVVSSKHCVEDSNEQIGCNKTKEDFLIFQVSSQPFEGKLFRRVVMNMFVLSSRLILIVYI